MKKGKLKIKNIILALIILILFIILIIKLISYMVNLNSTYNKLLKLGYTNEEVLYIESLNKEKIDMFLEEEYEPLKIDFMKEKYYIEDNLEDYIKYYKKNNKDFNEVVSIVNTKTHTSFYTDIKDTDTNKGILLLTNKFFKLSKDYVPSNLVTINLQYAYDNKEVTKETSDMYVKMAKDALKNNCKLVVLSAYRSYSYQEKLYEIDRSKYGVKATDKTLARAGHSEHQTGLAIDVNNVNVSFENSKEFAYLKDNAHKFGFILRYPKDKEHITGYSYEPWHYRYVGIEVATYIYENNITFDEYYMFYINKKD